MDIAWMKPHCQIASVSTSTVVVVVVFFALWPRSGVGRAIGDLVGVAPQLFQSFTLTLFEHEG